MRFGYRRMFGTRTSDDVFFRAFSAQAEKAMAGAQELRVLFTEIDASHHDLEKAAEGPVSSRVVARAEGIKRIEQEADTIAHEAMRRLHNTWITPIDREHIHALTSNLDDVLDAVEAVSERIVLFEVRALRPEAIPLCDVLVRSCEKLIEAMRLLPGLKSPERLLALCKEIDELESEADGIFRRAIAALYKRGNDPIDVLKWREIFDYLEEATDRCDDVANLIEGIVLEYA